MFGSSSIPFWTAIAALAAVGQVVVLIVTAFFVWRYLDETQKLRRTAQEQLRSSWSQVRIANDQLEAQIRPAVAGEVVFRGGSHQLDLTNVGNGAALSLRFSVTGKGSASDGRLPLLVEWQVTTLTPGITIPSPIRTGVQGPGIPSVPFGQSLQCQYKSLSARTYYTVIDFTADGTSVEATRLYWDPDFESLE